MDKIEPTNSQNDVFGKLKDFVEDQSKQVFILKGYAGTGKTTLIKVLIDALEAKKKEFTLLASTGRAAKILSNTTKLKTSTIHGAIYSFTGLNRNLDDDETKIDDVSLPHMDSTGQLYLTFELGKAPSSSTKIYIVDEASMISDAEDKSINQAIFGTGRLLHDLLSYDTNGKFIFVGDICQLPPVSQAVSPALNSDYFSKTFHIKAEETELTEIVRQSKENDIILSSQRVRKLYYSPQPYKWASFPFRRYKNIHLVSNQMDVITRYINNVRQYGFNKATLIGYSNRQCNMLTKLIRPSLGFVSPLLSKGDLLLITQNNYISGLMNGDLVTVEDIVSLEKRAGLSFLNVTVRELFTQKSYSQLLISEILYSNQTNLNQPQQKVLFIDFHRRMKDIGIKQESDEFNQMMLKDPYLNAIRAVFGYALTCHKAQGGEWDTVYLDIPRHLPSLQKPYVYQWIYTAMTRARQDIYTQDDFWIM